MFYNYSVPAPYRVMLTSPNNVLTNIMACYVFRSTKFGWLRDSPFESDAPSRPCHSAPISLSAFQCNVPQSTHTNRGETMVATLGVCYTGSRSVEEPTYSNSQSGKGDYIV